MYCCLQAAPPSTLYISRLVKQLIIAAEDQDQELSEQLLELNTALLLQGDAADATQVRMRPLTSHIGWLLRLAHTGHHPANSTARPGVCQPAQPKQNEAMGVYPSLKASNQ